MEEINLKELIDYCVSKYYILLIVLFITLSFGTLYSYVIKKPMYESSSTVILAGKKMEGTSYTQSDLTLNQNLTKTYSEIIKSRKVLDAVIKNNNLDYKVEDLADMVAVSNVSNTEIIKITVKSRNKYESAKIANAILPVFTKEVSDIYKFDNVSTLDKAVVSTKPSNINYLKEYVIYTLVGFILAFGIMFVAYYFDNTIKSRELIEDYYKLNVIGVIPMVNRGK